MHLRSIGETHIHSSLQRVGLSPCLQHMRKIDTDVKLCDPVCGCLACFHKTGSRLTSHQGCLEHAHVLLRTCACERKSIPQSNNGIKGNLDSDQARLLSVALACPPASAAACVTSPGNAATAPHPFIPGAAAPRTSPAPPVGTPSGWR